MHCQDQSLEERSASAIALDHTKDRRRGFLQLLQDPTVERYKMALIPCYGGAKQALGGLGGEVRKSRRPVRSRRVDQRAMNKQDPEILSATRQRQRGCDFGDDSC